MLQTYVKKLTYNLQSYEHETGIEIGILTHYKSQ